MRLPPAVREFTDRVPMKGSRSKLPAELVGIFPASKLPFVTRPQLGVNAIPLGPNWLVVVMMTLGGTGIPYCDDQR